MDKATYAANITGAIDYAPLPVFTVDPLVIGGWMQSVAAAPKQIYYSLSSDTLVIIYGLDTVNPPTNPNNIFSIYKGAAITTVPDDIALQSLAALPYVAAPTAPFTLTLLPGNNYVSFPVYETRTFGEIFGSAVSVYQWDTQTSSWSPIWPVAIIEPSVGYLIPASSTVSTPLYGAAYAPTADQIISELGIGWNLIGVGLTAVDISGTGYIATHDNPDGTRQTDITILEPGKAYWIEKVSSTAKQVEISSVPAYTNITIDGVKF